VSRARDFGAVGDGVTDDTEALAHALRDGDGVLELGRGTFLIRRSLLLPLDSLGRTGIDGANGTGTLLMAGPGPAIRLVGTHGGTADPKGFQPEIWERQRMPRVQNLEIRGAHPEADGIELVGTMQATLSGVLLRQLRDGIRATGRNRNLLVTGSHIYHNTGVGIRFDRLNLHQCNLVGNHISYNRLGGIRIERSEIRNLQITGNDIEYNNYRVFEGAAPGDPTAEIFFDCREPAEGVASPSIREFTISSNTIQATHSPGGCNIRIIGPDPTGVLPIGMGAITGNVIGNQAINVHLTACRGLALTGNHVYGGYRHNFRLEGCEDLTLSANVFGHNYWVPTREIDNNVSLEDCSDCVLQGLQFRGAPSGGTSWTENWEGGSARVHEAAFEFLRCRRLLITGCQVKDPNPVGMQFTDCSGVHLASCQIEDSRAVPKLRAALVWKGSGTGNRLGTNHFAGPVEIDPACEVAP